MFNNRRHAVRAAPLVKMSRTVSRVMSRIIIYLGLPLPAASSNLPESRPGKPVAFCLVLLRMGFTCAPPVTRRAVVSYSAFPPLPGPKALSEKRFVSEAFRGGLFLLHWPWSRLHRTLSGVLLCGARTFLMAFATRPYDRLGTDDIIAEKRAAVNRNAAKPSPSILCKHLSFSRKCTTIYLDCDIMRSVKSDMESCFYEKNKDRLHDGPCLPQ